ncbi:hypothetical protein Dimus_034448 [Dionaea muscipula]
MEPIASAVVDKLKSYAKSGEDFFTSLSRRRHGPNSRNPIEILKRLQREAFSDLMKLRDRQDKVERVLTIYKTSKAGPFQEDRTHVQGEVESVGTLLFTDDLDQQNLDSVSRAGIRTGTISRLVFGATVREKDSLEAEFSTSLVRDGYDGDNLRILLELSKVRYTANMADWFSMIAIPMGGRCKDVAVYAGPSSSQEKGLTDYSSYGPPLLHQPSGSGIGLTVTKSNAIASIAQFVAEYPATIRFSHCLSTFGQIVCQLSRSTRLSLFGLNQVVKSSQRISPQNLVTSVGLLRRGRPALEPSAPPLEPNDVVEESSIISTRHIALMVESELDESTTIRGWAQLKDSNPRDIWWAVTMSDSAEGGEMGWGLCLGGVIQGATNCDHFQVEAFLKFNLGRRFTLQPGIVCLLDGNNQTPAFVLRSTWSL